jgi:hypothetical protein
MIVGLLLLPLVAAANEDIKHVKVKCGLSGDTLVKRAAAIFASNGCRVVSAFPELGAITAEYIGDERDFYSPTTFHLALAGDVLHITVYRIVTISGGQVMYREVEDDVMNPIIAAIRQAVE